MGWMVLEVGVLVADCESVWIVIVWRSRTLIRRMMMLLMTMMAMEEEDEEQHLMQQKG